MSRPLLPLPIIIVSALLFSAGSSDARAGVSVDVGVSLNLFHDRLAVYGDWIHLDPYGSVWAPHRVPHAWRPYSVGHWVFTDSDWTWVSDEAWGWATYHYGRWAFDPVYGWVWIPDTLWGPAWVAWRWGGGFAGWAPLPPGVDVTLGPFDVELDPFAFTFVQGRFLMERSLGRHIVPVARNVTLVHATANVTRYEVVDHRVVNRGVAVSEVERSIGHRVTRLKLHDVATVGGRDPVDLRRKELAVYRPETTESMERRHAEERRNLEAAEAAERAQLRSKQAGVKAGREEASEAERQRQREAEARAQEAHELRERQLLEARQQRESEASRQAGRERAPQARSSEHR